MTKARILLVEDEPLIRSLLSDVLSEASFDVIEAATGAEAVTWMDRNTPFDLLMTDVHMPGSVDGVALARLARSRQPDLPVVFATGRPDTLRGLVALGPSIVCLAKPFSPLEALDTIRRLLAAAN